LFAGSQQAARACRRDALSLIESPKLNGHDPWAYLKAVFERLPTLKNRDLELLLPHNWRPANNVGAPAASATVPAAAHGTAE
jgi:transposase